MGFIIWCLGFGVWGLGSGVWGLGLGIWGLGIGVLGLGFGVGGLGFGVWGLGLVFLFSFFESRVWDLGFEVWSLDSYSLLFVFPRSAAKGAGVSIEEEKHRRNIQRFRGGLVFQDHRLLYHLTLGPRVTTGKRRRCRSEV